MIANEIPALDGAIPGAINLRTLGGLPVRDGVIRRNAIYRSAMTHHIEPAGWMQLAADHSLRTVVDLRHDLELAEDGVAAFTEFGIRHLNLPVGGDAPEVTPEARAERLRALMSGEGDWVELYLGMTENARESYRAFFDTLADEDSLAVLFHCSGGRDRTGVASALLLGALGADDAVIARDYARTGELLRPHGHRFMRIASQISMPEEEILEIVVGTDEATMLGFLAGMRERHGSVEGYLGDSGVSGAVIGHLRELLVEPA